MYIKFYTRIQTLYTYPKCKKPERKKRNRKPQKREKRKKKKRKIQRRVSPSPLRGALSARATCPPGGGEWLRISNFVTTHINSIRHP